MRAGLGWAARPRRIGGSGVDTIEGGTSTDFIKALDGEADHILCGQFDQLDVDPIDILTGC